MNRENLVMAASTGSGKTLAYSLPTIQNLHAEEILGYNRLPQRPRALILVPTRELARQVLQAIKQIGHVSKVSSCAVVGGEQYALQKTGVSFYKLNSLHDLLLILKYAFETMMSIVKPSH